MFHAIKILLITNQAKSKFFVFQNVKITVHWLSIRTVLTENVLKNNYSCNHNNMGYNHFTVGCSPWWILTSYIQTYKSNLQLKDMGFLTMQSIINAVKCFGWNSISLSKSTENSTIAKFFSLSGIWDKRPHFFPRTNWSFSLLWLLKVDGHNYTPPW